MIEVEVIVVKVRKNGKNTIEYRVVSRGVVLNRIIGSTKKRSKRMLEDYMTRNSMVVVRSTFIGGKYK